MDIKELINGLLDFNQNYEALCAENKDLIAENKVLREKIDFITSNSKKVPFNNVQKVVLERGKSKLLGECTSDWYKLKVKYNASERAFQSACYEMWLKDKVYKQGLPETVSYNEFITYFSKELHEMYEKERKRGIEILKMDMKNAEDEKESK